MIDKYSGGPAFPVHPEMAERLGCENSLSDVGMTLRDYFAAKALQGLVACSEADGTNDDFARWAYKYADAMLKARYGNP